MLPRRLHLLILATSVALTGCPSTGPIRQMNEGTYTLQPHQVLDLAPGVALAYYSFNDSRCPPDVMCPWAGKLVYEFSLKTPGANEIFTLGPGQPDYTSPALGGMHIVLDERTIPPPRPSQAPPLPHPVTLTLTRR
jgi:hypothetical protein